MPLNVLHFIHQGRAQWGVVRDKLITPIPGEFETTAAFIRANRVEALSALSGPSIKEAEVKLLSPITQNQQFLCLGANYRQHMIESGMNPDAKSFNMIFTKAPSCIVPANSDLVRPRRVRFLDYEIELGLVLKRDITSRQSITDANPHDSPHFQMTPKASAKTGSSARIVANRSINGSKRNSGMVGINS
jgi:2,4-diketo-3-deoxy-L-fuconate hydrolase